MTEDSTGPQSAPRQSILDSLIVIAGVAEGGFFLRKKPLGIAHSVRSRIENAISLWSL